MKLDTRNCSFLIPISLEPDVAHLWTFVITKLSKLRVSKDFIIILQRLKDWYILPSVLSL